ncbi:MAG: hypothetical protein KAS15_03640 [Nanoarchaeota archaeon]|nr:hypothetical protein [Nanoarchaeota archaeon]
MSELLNFYRQLEPESDLDHFAVKSKLEFLIQNIPDRFKQEYNRCFMYGFLTAADAIYKQDEGKLMNIPFFSENPQNVQVHGLAFEHFNFLVMYAGSLGGLMRVNDTPVHKKNELLQGGVVVFKGNLDLYGQVVGNNPNEVDYKGLVGELPEFAKREDLKQFARILQSQGHNSGRIS